jgi:hypothetical protein
VTDYETKIQIAFLKVYAENKEKGIEGASAHEVTQEMVRAGTISSMDTVIDIADLMKEMAGRGYFSKAPT